MMESRTWIRLSGASHYDLDDQGFVTLRDAGADHPPRYFPVRHLLSTAGFFEACRRIENLDDGKEAKRWLAEADRLSSAFRDYQLPMIRFRDADLESAVTVFARLNRTGRKMAADELVSALTYDEGEFDLARMLNEFKAELRTKGFGNLDRVLLLRSVLAALDRDIYAKDWADLMVKPEVRRALPDAFAAAKRGMLRALDLLAESRRHFRSVASLWPADRPARGVLSNLLRAGRSCGSVC